MASRRRTVYVILLVSMMFVLVNISSLQYNVTSSSYNLNVTKIAGFDTVLKNLSKDDSSENIEQLSIRALELKADKPKDKKLNTTHVKIKIGKEQNNSTHNKSNADLPSHNSATVEKTMLKALKQNGESQVKDKTIPKPDNIRTTSCSGCFKHNFKYIINNKNICKTVSSAPSIDLVIMILTTHSHVDRRKAIRETWLSMSKNNTANVRYVFLLGETSDKALHNRVLKENEIYHDIIKEDFVDSYSNLTYKTVMGYKWIVSHCSVAKYVMKTDDDMYINVWNILRLVHSKGKLLDNNLAGSCSTAAPIRNSKSKWYASINDYKELKYPGFCSGTAYVTSMQLAARLYNITASTPFFHLEDVYIGLCLYKLRGNIINVSGFSRDRVTLDPCRYKSTMMYSSHYVEPTMMYNMWRSECRKVNVAIH